MADKKIVTEEALSAFASDIKTALGSKADTSSIPTKVSDLTNDSDFQTGDDVDTAIATAIANKADIDGEYDLMTVGLAKQLKSNVGENDKVPYNFRTSGGSIDIGDRETDKIIGGSVAFNQIFDGTRIGGGNTFPYVNNDITYDLVNGVLTLNGTASSGSSLYFVCQIYTGHKYFRRNLKSNAFSLYSFYDLDDESIVEATSDNTYATVTVKEGVTLNNYKYQGMLIDLTQMFGSTIANYIYLLEQGTAGAGVAWFKKLFPKPYYAYNAGELISVKTSAHVMTGFNQASDVTYYNPSTAFQAVAKGNVRFMKGVKYCLSVDTPNTGVTVYFSQYNLTEEGYSATNITFDGTRKQIYITPEEDFTIEGVKILTTVSGTSASTGLCSNLCINISWDGERDGEYEPYEKHTYALDSNLELRGIPKLDANNKLYYDGDEYESDGTVTRKYGIVNLSTLDYTLSTSGLFQTTSLVSLIKKEGVSGANPSPYIVASLFSVIGSTAISGPQGSSPSPNRVMAESASGILYFNYTDVTTIDAFKTAMSGKYLVYALATPTTEQADSYQNPQIVDDFGTEEYVDTRAVAIPVGHETFYQANLRAKLEMSPDSPSGNGDYILRQTDGQNEYVVLTKELPTLPSTTDGVYVLKCTVAGGVATLSWVAES